MMKDEIEKRMDIARQFADYLTDPAKDKGKLDSLFQKKPDLRELFDNISAGINEMNCEPTQQQEWVAFQKKYLSPRHNRWNQILRYAAAACIIITTSVALSLYFMRQENPQQEVTLAGKFPTLSVSNEVHTLDSLGICHFNQQSHAIIQQTNKGMTYAFDTTALVKPEWHTVQVPHQTEFTLTLSDGSHVRLNAGTHLRYPVPFSKTTREIWVEGEAFFEVSPNKEKPFIVHFENNRITVLGTTFNVSCYKNQPSYTTLLSGCVCLRNSIDSVILAPGQEGIILSDQKSITVREADLKVTTAWLNDHFYFKEQSLDEIMKILGQWYDLDVRFEDNDLRDMLFSVETKRYGDIDSVLAIIESTMKVSFMKKDNIISIVRKQ